MTLQLRNSKAVSGRWLFNPAVTPGKIRASNLQSAKKFPNPQSDPRFAFIPFEKPQTSQISLPLSPQRPSYLWQTDLEMAPKRSSEKDGKGKESQPPSGEWTYSKCSNNELMNLVSEGLLQVKSLVNWHPLFANLFLWKMWTKSSHFTIFLNGVWLSLLALSSEAFFISTGLSSITSTRIQSATLLSSSIFAKLFLESNPIGIFSAFCSG
jgi:hypothetical protein